MNSEKINSPAPSPRLEFTIITLFPEALRPYLDSSMLYKAQNRGIIRVNYLNLRDFGLGPHKSVDDTPYGGGDGMLLRCEPVFAAVESVKQHAPDAEVILPTPVGLTWNQSLARQFAGIATPADDLTAVAELSVRAGKATPERVGSKSAFSDRENIAENLLNPQKAVSEATTEPQSQKSINTKQIPQTTPKSPENDPRRHFIIICPHYEGYDERILTLVDHKISLGPYVLTGGELAALIIIDSVTRLLPGVLGGETSATVESFSAGDNLEYPQYTKPFDFRGMTVPEVLLSGNHAAIAKWRADHSGTLSENEK